LWRLPLPPENSVMTAPQMNRKPLSYIYPRKQKEKKEILEHIHKSKQSSNKKKKSSQLCEHK
jgi:hypothetical protein